ncbi:MAG: hypothetical protein CMC56_01865 [Flavobacteriaceae bacterium]|nr:hypothetical protein [Flavobacteriaceae bacterium]
MAEEIINRVAKSKLITLNLEDFYPSGKRVALDIKNWLFQGLILKEKNFRETLKNYNWSEFKNHYVAVFCSSEAIVPAWAYMLVQTQLNGISKKTVFGTLETLETVLFCSIIDNMDLSFCEGKPVIIKGCSEKPVPQNAYLLLLEKLQPVARSIMYGEACSSVPLFKKK